MLGRFLVAAAGAAASYTAYSTACPLSQNWGRGFHRGPRNHRRVALTFDDGPSESTPGVLAVLRHYGIQATFFCCGANIERLPEITRAAAAAGHEIGNHTYFHPPLLACGADRVRRELEETQTVIKNTIGRRPGLFRPPYGLRAPSLARIQPALGLTAVLWSVIGWDWKFPRERIARRVLRGADEGAIICLHDGEITNLRADRRETIAALPEIIERLREADYSFVTAGEMEDQIKITARDKRLSRGEVGSR